MELWLKDKKCNNVITFKCTYIEPKEFLAYAIMDRELGRIQVTYNQGE